MNVRRALSLIAFAFAAFSGSSAFADSTPSALPPPSGGQASTPSSTQTSAQASSGTTGLGAPPVPSTGNFPSSATRVGGHIGVAFPLIDLDTGRKNFGQVIIADFFTVAIPVGVTVRLNDYLAFDFENILGNTLSPRGSSYLIVDPGVLLSIGPIVAGARVAVTPFGPANFGGILLAQKSFAISNAASFFVELDFPVTSVQNDGLHVGAAVHTGISF